MARAVPLAACCSAEPGGPRSGEAPTHSPQLAQVLACLPPTPWAIGEEELARRRDFRWGPRRLHLVSPRSCGALPSPTQALPLSHTHIHTHLTLFAHQAAAWTCHSLIRAHSAGRDSHGGRSVGTPALHPRPRPRANPAAGRPASSASTPPRPGTLTTLCLVGRAFACCLHGRQLLGLAQAGARCAWVRLHGQSGSCPAPRMCGRLPRA